MVYLFWQKITADTKNTLEKIPKRVRKEKAITFLLESYFVFL